RSGGVSEMCGIAGFWSPDGRCAEAAHATLLAMTAPIHHRGPDDGGTWADMPAGIALGFRRLAIIDLTPTGRQPMTSAPGRYVIVFNGGIYNFQALRGDLPQRAARFLRRSHTELRLAAG